MGQSCLFTPSPTTNILPTSSSIGRPVYSWWAKQWPCPEHTNNYTQNTVTGERWEKVSAGRDVSRWRDEARLHRGGTLRLLLRNKRSIFYIDTPGHKRQGTWEPGRSGESTRWRWVWRARPWLLWAEDHQGKGKDLGWSSRAPCRVGQRDSTGTGTRKSSGGSSQPWFRKRGREQKAKAAWQPVGWGVDGVAGGFLTV